MYASQIQEEAKSWVFNCHINTLFKPRKKYSCFRRCGWRKNINPGGRIFFNQLEFINKRQTADLKIYVVNLEKHYTRIFFFWDSWKCFSVVVAICKVQNSIILTLKVGEPGLIEYIDRDIFTTVICIGFNHEYKVNKYLQIFFQVYYF